MNTGLHDAVNLGWKLSLVLSGQAIPDLLQSYETERRPNVEKLLNYDKDISRLMTMQLPLGWEGDPKADPNEVLGVVMAEAATFSSGLGIFYEPDSLLNVNASFHCGTELTSAAPGKRVPDVILQKPGTLELTRVHKVTPNNGNFYVVVFTGDPTITGPKLKVLSDTLQQSTLYTNQALPVSWITISAKYGASACEVLGIEPFGKIFYDKDDAAHQRYSVDVKEGAIFVFRPDGWIGTAVALGETASVELKTYFDRFLLS
jgi:phenol 2-monooxygenase